MKEKTLEGRVKELESKSKQNDFHIHKLELDKKDLESQNTHLEEENGLFKRKLEMERDIFAEYKALQQEFHQYQKRYSQ